MRGKVREETILACSIKEKIRMFLSLGAFCLIRPLQPPTPWVKTYLQNILHSDIHLQILLTVSLQPVV